MEEYRAILLIIVVMILFVIAVSSSYERFTVVPYNSEFQRDRENSPIYESIPSDPKIKYPNAYYYEWQNGQYLQNLLLTFKDSCWTMSEIESTRFDEWTKVSDIATLDENIKAMYLYIYQHILTKVNESQYMRLRNSESIQIIHNVLYKYKKSADGRFIVLDIDFLFYRDSKLSAKHVNTVIAYEVENKKITVLECSVKGNVGSDTFYLFPVQATDELQPTYFNYSS